MQGKKVIQDTGINVINHTNSYRLVLITACITVYSHGVDFVNDGLCRYELSVANSIIRQSRVMINTLLTGPHLRY